VKVRVKIDNEVYEVEIENLKTRPILATVDGETFEVWPEENEKPPTTIPSSTPIQQSTSEPYASKSPHTSEIEEKTVTAPIPGVIISISVKEGNIINIGQELCVLEAMKMKNTIRAGRSGVINTIHITIGDTVGYGQPLFDFID
jgi:biotin carboxyl carrier protein